MKLIIILLLVGLALSFDLDLQSSQKDYDFEVLNYSIDPKLYLALHRAKFRLKDTGWSYGYAVVKVLTNTVHSEDGIAVLTCSTPNDDTLNMYQLLANLGKRVGNYLVDTPVIKKQTVKCVLRSKHNEGEILGMKYDPIIKGELKWDNKKQ